MEWAEVMARESGQPVIWNALLADGALNQHGKQAMSHRDAMKRLEYLNEEEGVRVFAQALTTNFASEFTLEDYNLADAIPCWKEACLGTFEEKMVKFADPVRRDAMKEDPRRARRSVRRRLRRLGEIKVHWISSDVPESPVKLKDTLRGIHDRRDRRAREQARRSTRSSTSLSPASCRSASPRRCWSRRPSR